MKYLNYTPHHVTVLNTDGSVLMELPPVSTRLRESARLTYRKRRLGQIGGVPVTERHHTGVMGLPPPQDGVTYVVSMFVAAWVGRDDVVAPGQTIRDANGEPIGCVGFNRIVWPARLTMEVADEEGI